MHIRLVRPAAIAAALALTFSAALAPMTASARQQVFGQWSTQNGRNQRQITGIVTYFSQYDLRIATGNFNGNGRYGSGSNDGRYGNGDDNGKGHRRHRHNDDCNGQNNDDDCNGRNNDGQYGNGQNNDGQYGNGQYGNGQYGNGQYGNDRYGNGNEERIRLHQGTVINPRGTNLRNGMQLRIIGHPNNDGTFEADRIDVIRGQNTYGNGYRR